MQLEERREQNPDLSLTKLAEAASTTAATSDRSGGGTGGGTGGYLGLGSSPKMAPPPPSLDARKTSLPETQADLDMQEAIEEMQAAMSGHQVR